METIVWMALTGGLVLAGGWGARGWRRTRSAVDPTSGGPGTSPSSSSTATPHLPPWTGVSLPDDPDDGPEDAARAPS